MMKLMGSLLLSQKSPKCLYEIASPPIFYGSIVLDKSVI